MKIVRGKKVSRRMFGVLLALAIIVGGVVVPTTPAYATKYGPSDFLTMYLSQVYPDIQQIAKAYIVGDDGIPNMTDKTYIQRVEPGTKIQGQTISEEYLPQDNMECLREMYESAVTSGTTLSWPDCAYIERECATLQVVYYDEEKVIFWSDGYRSFTALSPTQCKQDVYKESHRPGFYQIGRNMVWLDTGRSEKYNVIPDSEKNLVAGTGQITGTTVAVRPVPGKDAKGVCYGLQQNTTCQLASTERIAAIDGSTDTYYKIRLNGSTDGSYMKYKSDGYYYINSLYVNVQKKGASAPAGLTDGYVVNLSSGKGRRVYGSASASVANTEGVVSNGVTLEIYPNESDSKWTAIWFNGKKCYLESAYVKTGTQTPEYKKVTNLRIKDVVNGKYVLTWDAAAGCTDYSIAFMEAKELDHYSLGDAIGRDLHFKGTTYTVPNTYFKGRNAIFAIVTANYGSQTTKITYIELKMPEKPEKFEKWQLLQDRGRLYFMYCPMVQYATNKNFKNAKTISNGSMQKSVKGLKKGQTYYVRYCNYETVKTDNGKKQICSKWSKVRTVKYTGKSDI